MNTLPSHACFLHLCLYSMLHIHVSFGAFGFRKTIVSLRISQKYTRNPTWLTLDTILSDTVLGLDL
jgi:hypothetical protein